MTELRENAPRLSTVVSLVGVVRLTRLPPPGIPLGAFLVLVGGALRYFTGK